MLLWIRQSGEVAGLEAGRGPTKEVQFAEKPCYCPDPCVHVADGPCARTRSFRTWLARFRQLVVVEVGQVWNPIDWRSLRCFEVPVLFAVDYLDSPADTDVVRVTSSIRLPMP